MHSEHTPLYRKEPNSTFVQHKKVQRAILKLVLTSFVFTTGFWANSSCNKNASSSVQRLWDLTCNDLADFPNKKSYLRQFNINYLLGSKAVYDCMVGHAYPDGVS